MNTLLEREEIVLDESILDPDLMCAALCGRTASLRVACCSCPNFAFTCDTCYLHLLAAYTISEALGRPTCCYQCRTIGTFRELFKATPI